MAIKTCASHSHGVYLHSHVFSRFASPFCLLAFHPVLLLAYVPLMPFRVSLDAFAFVLAVA